MSPSEQAPARLLVLSGGLIHLVHQLAVALTLLEEMAPGRAAVVAVMITGVLRNQPDVLASLHQDLERWLSVLRDRQPTPFSTISLVAHPGELEHRQWDVALVNNQWLATQRQLVLGLAIPNLVVCGDGLGVYYRCARELRALLPSLLKLPIAEPGLNVEYRLSGRQPNWHRPPCPSLPVLLAWRQELFATVVEGLRERGEPELDFCLANTDPDRPIWLCSVPNLAHQFPERQIHPQILVAWSEDLRQQHGFSFEADRLLLIDHPKAPPHGSFGRLKQAWLAPPLRSTLPLEVLIRLLQEARPQTDILVSGMTSALYGVQRLTGARVHWLSTRPLWRHNPLYRRRPLEFLHRWLRKSRVAQLTAQGEPEWQSDD